MSDVVMRNVVKEETSSPSKKGTIHSRDGTTEERPLLVTVMGDRGVRVMEVSQHDDPVVR